jgi:hypothetical protein
MNKTKTGGKIIKNKKKSGKSIRIKKERQKILPLVNHQGIIF